MNLQDIPDDKLKDMLINAYRYLNNVPRVKEELLIIENEISARVAKKDESKPQDKKNPKK